MFYSFGEISSVRLVRKQQIAFVEYTLRESAEQAAKSLHNKLVVKGTTWTSPTPATPMLGRRLTLLPPSVHLLLSSGYRLRLTWATRPAGPPPGAMHW